MPGPALALMILSRWSLMSGRPSHCLGGEGAIWGSSFLENPPGPWPLLTRLEWETLISRISSYRGLRTRSFQGYDVGRRLRIRSADTQ